MSIAQRNQCFNHAHGVPLWRTLNSRVGDKRNSVDFNMTFAIFVESMSPLKSSVDLLNAASRKIIEVMRFDWMENENGLPLGNTYKNIAEKE